MWRRRRPVLVAPSTSALFPLAVASVPRSPACADRSDTASPAVVAQRSVWLRAARRLLRLEPFRLPRPAQRRRPRPPWGHACPRRPWEATQWCSSPAFLVLVAELLRRHCRCTLPTSQAVKQGEGAERDRDVHMVDRILLRNEETEVLILEDNHRLQDNLGLCNSDCHGLVRLGNRGASPAFVPEQPRLALPTHPFHGSHVALDPLLVLPDPLVNLPLLLLVDPLHVPKESRIPFPPSSTCRSPSCAPEGRIPLISMSICRRGRREPPPLHNTHRHHRC